MSNDTNTGGPAFPSSEYDPQYDRNILTGGMTLRDYFAAKAMHAAMMNITDWKYAPNSIATYSYDQADAMLKARDAK
jgi:hypothetical protein